jgi:ADP-ribose pyrophosphatase YjhB (NUDIX family)
MRVRPGILLLNDSRDRILLLRYHYGDADVYGIPGGNPIGKETLIQTLKREMLEELMIGIRVSHLAFIGEGLNRQETEEVLHCIFVGRIVSGIPTINPKHTSALGVEWKAVKTVPFLNLYPNFSQWLTDASILKPDYNAYVGTLHQHWFG